MTKYIVDEQPLREEELSGGMEVEQKVEQQQQQPTKKPQHKKNGREKYPHYTTLIFFPFYHKKIHKSIDASRTPSGYSWRFERGMVCCTYTCRYKMFSYFCEKYNNFEVTKWSGFEQIHFRFTKWRSWVKV